MPRLKRDFDLQIDTWFAPQPNGSFKRRTEWVFKMPRHHERELTGEPEHGSQGQHVESSEEKARVLIVEDELLVAEEIQRTLRSLDYTVVACIRDASKVLEAVDTSRPDLVLMDIRLAGSGTDGIELAREIHRLQLAPVMFLSGYADDETVDRASSIRPYGYLVKPVRQRELRVGVELALHRRRLEAAVDVRERWLSTTLQSIGDAVFATDAEGRLTLVNNVAVQLLGCGREELMGKPLESLLRLVGPGGERVGLRVRDVLSRIPVARLEPHTSLMTRAGEAVSIEESCAPIIDEHGEIVGSVFVFRDVRERAKLESKLAFTERLAAVGTLAAGVAHEINNPLSYVVANLGFASSELDCLAESARRDHAAASRIRSIQDALGDVSHGVDRVRHLVSEMKKLASPDCRPRAPVHPIRCAEAAIGRVRPALERSAKIVCRYGQIPLIEADEARLIQVLVQLLQNAAEAIGTRDPEHDVIEVSTMTSPEGRAIIQVSDSGPGIPTDVIPRMFDPFYTTKPLSSSIGLGLSVAEMAVRSMGGEISASSPPGKGATMNLVFPPANIPHQPSSASASQRRGRVLVVDDEPALARSIDRALRREHDVTLLTRGRAAIERLQSAEFFDAVFCDISMPDVSGVDVYESTLRSNPEQAKRFVFITGGATSDETAAFLSQPGIITLPKPFSLERIRATVRERVDDSGVSLLAAHAH